MTHSGMVNCTGFIGRVALFGKYTVELFFMISMYLNMKSYDRYIKCDQGKDFWSIVKWCKRRIIKIIPAYYFCILIYLSVFGGEEFWYGSDGHVTVINIISHLLFFNIFIPKHINSIIGVEWYLVVLFWVIVFTPLIYKYVKSKIRSIVFLIISLFVYVIWSKCDSFLLISEADFDIYKSFWLWMSFIPNLPTVALGTVIYYSTDFADGATKKEKRVVSISLLLFALWMIWGSIYGYTNLYYCPIYFQWSLWFMLIILSQYVYTNVILTNVVFEYIGKNSLLVYLIHPFIFKCLDLIHKFEGTYELVAKYVIGLVISLLCSIIYKKLDNLILKKKNG